MSDWWNEQADARSDDAGPGGEEQGATRPSGERPARRGAAGRHAAAEAPFGSHGGDEPRPRPPARRKLNVVIVVLASLGVLQLLYLNYVESDRMFVLRREVARLEADVARLETERHGLEEVAAHAADAAYREALARKQGFILPDEVRVVTGAAGGQ